VYQTAVISAYVTRALSSTSKWPFFFKSASSYYHQQHLHSLPPRECGLGTHIIDTYDVYTTLGPPMNSLRRSPTEYRCNEVSRKTLLVYCNGIISSPYVLNQPPQHTLLQNSVVFVTTTFGSAADKDVYIQLPAECEEEGRCTYYFLPSTTSFLPVVITPLPTLVN